MHLIIHSGQHKTATSSFQHFCYSVRELLLEAKVYYPNLSHLKDNSSLIELMSPHLLKLFDIFNNHNPLALLIAGGNFEEVEEYFQKIFKEANDLECQYILISSEDFENFFVDIDIAMILEKTLQGIGFDKISWVFVKREPFAYLNSIYAELSKHKMVVNFDNLSNEALRKGYVDVCGGIYNWKFIFDNIFFCRQFESFTAHNLLSFSYNEFVDDDCIGKVLFKYFLSEDKIKLLVDNYVIKNSNPRVSQEKVEFQYLFNYLGLKSNQQFYNANKKYFDSLIQYRIEKINLQKPIVEKRFREKFSIKN